MFDDLDGTDVEEEVEDPFPDLVQEALLTSSVTAQRVHIGARAIEEVEVAHEPRHRISRERAPMEVAARLLMGAEWQKINKLNAQTCATLNRSSYILQCA
jgi:hypothetical protein